MAEVELKNREKDMAKAYGGVIEIEGSEAPSAGITFMGRDSRLETASKIICWDHAPDSDGGQGPRARMERALEKG